MEIKLKNIKGITVYEDEYTNVRVEAVGMKMSDGTISNVLTVLKNDKFLLHLHKFITFILHPSKINFYKIAQNGCLYALDTSILKRRTH